MTIGSRRSSRPSVRKWMDEAALLTLRRRAARRATQGQGAMPSIASAPCAAGPVSSAHTHRSSYSCQSGLQPQAQPPPMSMKLILATPTHTRPRCIRHRFQLPRSCPPPSLPLRRAHAPFMGPTELVERLGYQPRRSMGALGHHESRRKRPRPLGYPADAFRGVTPRRNRHRLVIIAVAVTAPHSQGSIVVWQLFGRSARSHRRFRMSETETGLTTCNTPQTLTVSTC